MYVNLPQAAAIASANAAKPIPPEKLGEMQQNQGLAATVMLQPDGILFRGISWLHPESEKLWVVENNAQMSRSGGNRLDASLWFAKYHSRLVG